MHVETKIEVAATANAPLASIKRIEPKHLSDCSKCEGNVHFGIFFDGTNNNMDADKPNFSHTNIVRLFDAYLRKRESGYDKLYVPGVGTPFPEIGEDGESSLGSGFAIGCEQRVLYALCWVFNALHRAAFREALFFNSSAVKALCRNQANADLLGPREEYLELIKLGVSAGLRMPDFSGDGMREDILKAQSSWLEMRLSDGRPRIKECFIDVFGFSRGAAQARVFCNWLDRILQNGKLAGVIVHLRFLGLMDSVASAGFWSSTVGNMLGMEHGHSGWAAPEFLRIPASVKNCLHMIAMHELRKNFPLDTVSVDGKLPPNCQEFAYPGAHSDVGGGYPPGALGVAVGNTPKEGDALKVAQIPLNHMLDCACAAGAPMTRETAQRLSKGYDPFLISPRTQKAFSEFLALSTQRPRSPQQWLQPYLNWRWEIHKRFTSQLHVQLANEKDRELLIKFNDILTADAALITRTAGHGYFRKMIDPTARVDAAAMLLFDPEAHRALSIAKSAAPTSKEVHALFDGFVHDSLAGFDHHALERTGYWRYRKGFLGGRASWVASNDGDVIKSKSAG